jgi:hypothetical protein
MFGRKPKIGSQMQDLEALKLKMAVEEAKQVKPVAPAQPSFVQELSPFFVAEKRIEERKKTASTPSGQIIYTGEVENVEMNDVIFELTLEDVIDIVANCKGTPIGLKARKLLQRS